MRLTAIAVAFFLSGIVAVAAGSPAGAQTYKQIYSFPGGKKNGAEPSGSLISFQGKLYGTTASGGGSRICKDRVGFGCGTVFSLNPTSGKETVVYRFQGGTSDGSTPESGLTNVGSLLYGTTTTGGIAGVGTVFSVDPATHLEKIIYSFQGGSDGSDPFAELLNVSGVLYGTTLAGGTANLGTVFSLDPASGTEKVIYSFQGGVDGKMAYGGLIDGDGTLYGTTLQGGNSGEGTVFSVDPVIGTEAVLHSFGTGKDDGVGPYGSLTKVGNKLFGTTSAGGSASKSGGIVFSINPATGAEKIVYSFDGPKAGDEWEPLGGLLDIHGLLYGTTQMGGSSANCGLGCGTVFVVDPATGLETILYSFEGPGDGLYPSLGNLLNVRGTIYGVAGGGIDADGEVYALTP